MEEDKNIKIEKFIYSNPDIGNKFSYEIFRRKEYYDNRLGPVENIVRKQGVPLLSQKLASTFFSKYTQYRSGLFFHEPGTGKTCLSSFIIENFKNTLVDDHPRSPALIIVPNETLEKNYRRDIEKQCTNEGTYKIEFTKEEKRRIYETKEAIQLTKETKQRRLKSAISKTYEIVTHETFLSSLSPNEEQVKREYSNRIIVIDEAHHFRMQTSTGQGKKKKATATDKALAREPGITIELYTKLHKFLHTVENCRILLLTGTPVWDQVYEIASLMNLILDKDNQLPIRTKFLSEYFDDEKKLLPDKSIELKEKFKGLVSFLRPMQTTATKIEIGISKPWLNRIKIYPSVMSDFQYKNYQKAMKEIKVVSFEYKTKNGKIIKAAREIEGGPMRLFARDAATFVFPDGSYGSDGYNKNIIFHQKSRYIYKNQQIAESIKNNLKNLSSKFSSLIKLIKDHPKELVFIYDEYIMSGGGVINLSLVLEQHGFFWAKSAADISKPSKQKRFCSITSFPGTLNSPKRIEEFINSFNKPDNKYGDRCQIIIGSRKIAEGVTIKNVRQGHIIMGHWNSPSLDQALGRIFRVGSHDAFENSDEKYIKIFKHVSVKKGDISIEPIPDSFSDEMTLDLTIYKIAEDKEYLNSQIYRLLKEVAWDCPLTYGRNVLKGEEDYSRSTDYQSKNYRCYDFPSKYIDKTEDVWKYDIPEENINRDTYDLFYNTPECLKLMGEIKKLFERESAYHLDYFFSSLNLERDEEFLLLKTLDYMISAKIKIKNKYGFFLSLQEFNNIYYLDNTFNSNSNYSSLLYKESPIIYEVKSLEQLSNINQYVSDKQHIKDFCKNPSIENIKKMNYRTLIILLETMYKMQSTKSNLNPKENLSVKNVMDVLGSNLHKLDDENVIHVMYNTEYMGLGYNIALQEIVPNGNMRIFKDGKWSYVKNIEDEENYIRRLKTTKKTIVEEEWDQYPHGLYGFTDTKDGKFKIKVKPEPGQRMTKGSVCLESLWSVPKLYNLMNKLNALPEPDDNLKGLKRKDLMDRIAGQPLLKTFLDKDRSDDELRMILTVHTMDKKALCGFLQKWFQKHNMYKEI
jgi:hypothetical protein